MTPTVADAAEPGTADSRPVVIFGGFLAPESEYRGMRAALAAHTGLPVSVVHVRGPEWLLAISPRGWLPLLGKLDRAVRDAASRSITGKVTLVGHSAGGVLARIYLSDQPFLGRLYRGLDRVAHLVTLGSPHHNRCRRLHGGLVSCWADRLVPGAFYSPAVAYTSVAGKSQRGNCQGAFRERHACDFYRKLGGDGDGWGDGLVPLSSALLAGSRQVTLDGVSHHSVYGQPWYGSAAAVPRWWDASQLIRASAGRPDPDQAGVIAA